MNEASSKFVDQIATQKLLDEKLNRVHHALDPSADWSEAGFDDFSQLSPLPQDVDEILQGKVKLLVFPSARSSPYPENNQVICRQHSPQKLRADLVFVHGLYEDNLEIYNYFISQLVSLGIRVTLMELPYHYDRCPTASRFSGEYFWSADLLRSALAYKQAVYDLYQTYNLLRKSYSSCTTTGGDSENTLGSNFASPIGIAGFSMGGGIALSLAGRFAVDCLFLINPVCNISQLVWSSSLFAPIRRDLETHHIDFDTLKAHYVNYEPLESGSAITSRDRIFLAHSLYDQINEPANYQLLIERWGLENELLYKAGHLNILRVPRLASDIAAALLQPAEISSHLPERSVAE